MSRVCRMSRGPQHGALASHLKMKLSGFDLRGDSGGRVGQMEGLHANRHMQVRSSNTSASWALQGEVLRHCQDSALLQQRLVDGAHLRPGTGKPL